LDLLILPVADAQEASLLKVKRDAILQFSADKEPPQPAQELSIESRTQRLNIPPAGASYFLEVPNPGTFAFFFQHQPEEFQFQMTLDSTPISAAFEARFQHSHSHDSTVSSVGVTVDHPMDLRKFDAWISSLLRDKGVDLFRSKGILNFHGAERRFVFQGVHMIFDGKLDRPWRPDEPRKSQIIFIGRHLDRCALVEGFQSCIA
jgi:G3E family GTPase